MTSFKVIKKKRTQIKKTIKPVKVAVDEQGRNRKVVGTQTQEQVRHLVMRTWLIGYLNSCD